jgi:hypothetical protein
VLNSKVTAAALAKAAQKAICSCDGAAPEVEQAVDAETVSTASAFGDRATPFASRFF